MIPDLLNHEFIKVLISSLMYGGLLRSLIGFLLGNCCPVTFSLLSKSRSKFSSSVSCAVTSSRVTIRASSNSSVIILSLDETGTFLKKEEFRVTCFPVLREVAVIIEPFLFITLYRVGLNGVLSLFLCCCFTKTWFPTDISHSLTVHFRSALAFILSLANASVFRTSASCYSSWRAGSLVL